jgi:phosphonate transport system substrate-binding protein
MALCIPAQGEEARVYRVGVVPQFDSRTTHDIWSPILLQLQATTGFQFQWVGSPSIPEFEKRVAEQDFDFVYINPYQGLVASADYTPLVRDVKIPLQGIIVVRKDSALTTLPALQGKAMDFPAPNALAASLMPRAHLAHIGVQVQVRYVKTHSSVYLNVATGQTDAGGGVLQTLEDQPASVRGKLKILYTTQAVPSHPIMGNKRLSLEVRERVRTALIALGDTESGRSLLQRVPIDKIGPTVTEDYAVLKRMNLERFYVPN